MDRKRVSGMTPDERRAGDSKAARFFRGKDEFMHVNGYRSEDYMAAMIALRKSGSSAAEGRPRSDGERLLELYVSACIRGARLMQDGDRDPDHPAWDELQAMLPELKETLYAFMDWSRKNPSGP